LSLYVIIKMDKNQIKKELASSGYDLSMVAEALDKSPSLISKVLARQAKSRFVAEAIARVLDRDVTEIFPDVPEYQTAVPVSDQQRKKKVSELKNLLSK